MARIDIDKGAGDRATTLHVTGPLIFGDEAGAVYRAAVLLFKEGRSRLVIDLAGVTEVDATGLGELVDVGTAARHRGGEVALERADARTEALLDAAGFRDVFSAR